MRSRVNRCAFVSPVFFTLLFFTGCEIADYGLGDPLIDTRDGATIVELDDPPLFLSAGTAGEDYWVAKARYGDNLSTGDFELEVGYGYLDSKEGDIADHVWSSKQNVPFCLTYDGCYAQLVLGGTTLKDTMDSVSHPVAGMSDAFVMALRSPARGSVSVSSLKINGGSLSQDTCQADASLSDEEVHRWFLFENLPVDNTDSAYSFELTGILQFIWVEGTTKHEVPAMEIDVKMR